MGDSGTCAFCGFGDGFLGDQGDERSQIMPATVRTGEAPDWKYERHPNAYDAGDARGAVTWCGECVGGLIHKFQRYDDTNLRAFRLSGKLRLELDGLRWAIWERDEGEDALRKYKDDPAIHLDKLRLERDVRDAEMEEMRRCGADLTDRGWRP